MQAIASSAGLLRISDLCCEVGCSQRYLDLKFTDQIGLSPKALARIVRFQQFYKLWARGVALEAFQGDLYDYYYDQAHFIKEFKRFTGYSPFSFGRKLRGIAIVFGPVMDPQGVYGILVCQVDD